MAFSPSGQITNTKSCFFWHPRPRRVQVEFHSYAVKPSAIFYKRSLFNPPLSSSIYADRSMYRREDYVLFSKYSFHTYLFIHTHMSIDLNDIWPNTPIDIQKCRSHSRKSCGNEISYLQLQKLSQSNIMFYLDILRIMHCWRLNACTIWSMVPLRLILFAPTNWIFQRHMIELIGRSWRK
jgi:hypothetical protein